MGKDDKEDSGFGFKDKAKAEDTLRLLEKHDPNYRRLTVRGLLGRAKRVLTMTKAEDKIKNIKEAMEVFENWLAELEKNKEQKSDKKEKNREQRSEERERKKKKSEEEAAKSTLQELEGRDPDYQKLAVKGLIGRAKRVLTCTRDETKLSNIKEAISIFDKFLDDFDTMHLSKQNNPYISLAIVRTCVHLADANITEQQKAFIEAYTSAGGEYKRLRTVLETEGGKTWDIVRNAALKQLKEKHADAKLFNEKDEPTAEHLEMLLWAYSPEPARVKKLVAATDDTKRDTDRKRRSSRGSDDKVDDRKRRSSHDSDDSPSKKKKE
nr:uncharacterized protein LOC117995059 isoform X2 [Maniola hyperantus]